MKFSIYLFLITAGWIGNAPFLWSQVGNNNPTGPAGSFSGEITTGCAYNFYTGNATRAVTDMVVPGGVGAYPLAFGRTSNSRGTSGTFGLAGAWRHSYQWEMLDSDGTSQNFAPNFYTVSFPDGRVIDFAKSTTDSYFRGPLGISERFQPLNTVTLLAYLILSDGGKIEFKATRKEAVCDFENHLHCEWGYSYTAQAIIDPYGLRTELRYNGNGTLNTVTDASGRWIQLHWGTGPLDHITGSDGRSVQYNYAQQAFPPGAVTYICLANVVYYGDSSLTASYTYQAPNVPAQYNLVPLLSTCIDPMYQGPMKRISYTYATGVNSDQLPVVLGQIRSENSFDGQIVSNLSVYLGTRTETKGDGGFRYFTFPTNYQLSAWSDYVHAFNFASRQYDTRGFPLSETDLNGHTTSIASDPRTGNPTKITYPLTSSDVTVGNPAGTITYTYGGSPACSDPNNTDANNPYYLCSATNERQHVVSYLRDGTTHRITDVNYPDANYYAPNTPSHEGFRYNQKGQIERHQRRNGSYEHIHYNERWLPDIVWNPISSAVQPATAGNEAKTVIVYYGVGHVWQDRVQSVTDARGYTTEYEYDRKASGEAYGGRGLVTRITHPLVTGETERKYISLGYDRWGNVSWRENEVHQRTSFFYDDYQRLSAVKTPLPNSALATTSLSYNPQDDPTISPYVWTAALPTRIATATGVVTTNIYDRNRFLESRTVAPGTSKAAKTSFGYDDVGNLTSVMDPLFHESILKYDERNRKEKATSAAVSLPGGGTTHYVTQWIYDPASNVIKVIQPDLKEQVRSYDPANRLEASRDALQRLTTYTYRPSGMLKDVTDPKLHVVGFEYDNRDLKTKMGYPSGEVRAWRYDAVGNLEKRELPRPGPSLTHFGQTFAYDERNRLKTMRWDDNQDWANFGYDPVGRLTQADNPYSYITRDYDEGGRLLFDRQDLLPPTADPGYRADPPEDEGTIIPHVTGGGHQGNSNSLVAEVKYEHDADGRVKRLWILDTTYDYHFGYDEMGRPETISKTGVTPGLEFQYIYDRNSFVTQRNNFINGTAQVYVPDELSRMKQRKILLPGASAPFSDERYTYDQMSRVASVYRTEDGLGDTFEYNGAGELTKFRYGLEPDGQGGYLNPPPSRVGIPGSNYILDDAGNRSEIKTSDFATFWTTDEFNQYTLARDKPVSNNSLLHQVINYDGVDYSYLYDGHLQTATSAQSTYAFGYDALGRCVRRALNGSAIVYAYDGARSIAEYDSSESFGGSTLYGSGIDEVLARGNAEQSQYYMHQDRLGSVTAVTNFQGQVIETYRYDDFGAPTIRDASGMDLVESAINNRFLFTGREYNKLGFYEYRARAYHPGLGRFLSEDPMGLAAGDTNFFRYCGGDPINRTDPSGLLGPDPRFNTEAKNSGSEADDLGKWNWGLSGGTGPGSTQGFWSNPDGTPTGIGGSGPPSSNRLGSRGGGGLYFTYLTQTYSRVVVTPQGSFINTLPSAYATGLNNGLGTFGFGPGQITTNRGGPSLYQVFSRPPTAEEKAWTDKGRVPTLVAAAVLSAPLWAPEAVTVYAAAHLAGSGANVAWAGGRVAATWGAQWLYYNPAILAPAITAANAFSSPGWDFGGTAAFYGSFGNASLNAALQIMGVPEIGP